MGSSTRVDVAIRGVRLMDAPVSRRAGAGPSDDGHVLLDGVGAAIPLNPRSPYSVDGGRLLLDGADTGMGVEAVARPRFYDLVTEDGVPYEQIARLHSAHVLATTVVQTCVRYAESERCRFCAIEESLRQGSTIAVKTPAQIAEVALAAHELDGVSQLVMTTGTSRGRDRGATHLARCVRAVREVLPDLPIQVQCEPPGDLATLSELHRAGANSIGIHVESLDDDARLRWMPGKGSVPMSEYRAAWAEAVRVFGWNQVSTYLLIGLGEDPDELVAGAEELIAMGVYPFVVPFRPLAGTLATEVDHVPAPAYEVVADVTSRVAAALRRAGMAGADQAAGCAACGACSALGCQGG
ncbi:MSMEG_0568 family radical SAM protein [Nocardioides mangrovicus]|uniref:MSMEG_0568 family radical SAM protein n=1 Tax=Nocardioides mangrovicus TaxID=2478913 RepID=A0A3L8P840_9ACTN|nr:MSMEG_0568 family radical SAM protein [Nocardioides mangrovicus]RLV50558.1 MSMEG_0568 family radical SAM protein [Nocardioides mangrovicus]